MPNQKYLKNLEMMIIVMKMKTMMMWKIEMTNMIFLINLERGGACMTWDVSDM